MPPGAVLLYPSGTDRASNVPVTIQHADGKAELKWDMRKGSRNGFSVEVGKYRFQKGKPNTVTLSTRATDGRVIADGVALIGVVLSLTDDEPGSALPIESGFSWRENEDEDNLGRLFLQPLTRAMLTGMEFSSSIWLKYLSLLMNPWQAIGYAKAGAGIAAEITKLALMSDDAPTRFKGVPGIGKRVAWSEPLLLPDIKAVGKAFACSVNDVLLSAVAGALAAYLAEKGEGMSGEPCDVGIRALVPVNLRKPEAQNSLGNCFGMVTLELPVGLNNPLARLYETRRRMQALKESYQAMAALTILAFVGLMPKFIQELVLDLLAANRVAILSHVQPGSRFNLTPGAGLLTSHGQDQTNLELVVLRIRLRYREAQGGNGHGAKQ